jgi:predicted regulator of Ras-like GTPase activity (Roadblock/LC7/MglB family)
MAGKHQEETMIPFRKKLAEIVEKAGGGLGAVIMGYDGIAIDEYISDQRICDVQLLAVEYATLLKEVNRTVSLLKTGELEEMTIATASANVIVRTINDEFFLLLVIEKDGNYGKGRFLLRKTAPLLRDELQ